MLDEEANRQMEEVIKRSGQMVEALRLTPEECEFAVQEAKAIMDSVADRYLDERLSKDRKIRTVAAAGAVALALSYFDKWAVEMARKFPDLNT